MGNLLRRLKAKQQKGSKPRCHWLTNGQHEEVAERLNELIAPCGRVTTMDCWMPQGFGNIEEAQLHNAPNLLDVKPHGEALISWWLAEAGPTTMKPNWDIASTCTIDGKRGLLLVEAKAHLKELKRDDCCGAGDKNFQRIGEAIREANDALNHVMPGWDLTHEHHYQLSNRFAWSWKLACLGIPVVLVYLGFLKANEMPDSLSDEQSWNIALRNYARNIVPKNVWNSKLMIGDTPIHVFIRSKEISLDQGIGQSQPCRSR